jgi:hypothetical protein
MSAKVRVADFSSAGAAASPPRRRRADKFHSEGFSSQQQVRKCEEKKGKK